MESFVQIKLHDNVYDRVQGIHGIVTDINYKTNIASVTTGSPSEDEPILCRLSNLNVIKRVKPSKGNLEIKVKYFDSNSTRLSKIVQGDWIDLRTSKTIEMKEGEFKPIPLGIAMKLPSGYEAIVVPRSSTFKNYGIIQTNSKGVIDNSYSGNDDQWFFPAYALRDTVINFDERICQFRIQECMPSVAIQEVDFLDNENRGGHGSTGVK